MPFSAADELLGLAVGLVAFGALAAIVRRSSDRNVYLSAFAVKLLASVASGLLPLMYYAGIGDNLAYHEQGVEYAAWIRSDLDSGTTYYLSEDLFFLPNGISTTRFYSLSGLIHLFVADSFLASSFIFAALGFSGQVLLYRVFVAHYPDARIRPWWILGILFFPSLTFWSSGLLKDTLGFFALGLVVWGAHRAIRAPALWPIVVTLFGLYTLVLFRLQIVPAVAVGLSLWWFTSGQGVRSDRRGWVAGSAASRGLTAGIIAVAGVAGLVLATGPGSQLSLLRLPELIVAEGALYDLVPDAGSTLATPLITEPSWPALLRVWPQALVTALYRPYVWEAPGIVGVVAAVENLVLLLLTGRAVLLLSLHGALRRVLRSPLFLMCLAFVAIFALGVGASTPSLGALSRYRMPMMPFFVALLAIVEHHCSSDRGRGAYYPMRRADSALTGVAR